MDEVLNSTLRTAVYGRLDYLDTIVDKADNESKSALADTVISQMTGAWRELLEAHEPDGRGRCRACSSWRLLGRAGCSVWRTAHRHLITDAAEYPAATGKATGRHHFRSATPTSS
ncbi:hypothetical protein [Amycolatopsis sp. EV170708-02-1]|uniref:hypothetical protein n=1 Tax=Amycolatopsis sp. EV170708-02-1 TaxID=2919322 RepID=UPI001F0C41F3|nr:hypothetical protein [Amycolatopsis sp. EV170708-02-1]UMP06896.1 hypothetical protein MJQ72_19715 [Amycolatopsis sp. EV170708-02-1]